MENRLCLNSVPKFDLPQEIQIRNCNPAHPSQKSREEMVEAFGEPTLRMVDTQKPIRVLGEGEQRCIETWIWTNNKELEDWIRAYDWNGAVSSVSGGLGSLKIWKLKKIITEEFYNV